MRTYECNRATAETKITLSLQVDGQGKPDIDTGVGFLNHMLTLFAFHARFDVSVKCRGDVDVDDHHSVEDVGIVLGKALKKALGDKAGIARYGQFLLPMDEALVLCALDLSGRAYLNFDVEFPTEKVGTFDTELVREFMMAFSREAGMTLHFKMLSGINTHHIIEAMFKGMGKALQQAVSVDYALGGQMPSTKGTLI